MKRKSECPECKDKLAKFYLNVDTGTIEYLRYHAQINPVNVLRDSDIVYFSKQLPVDKQEAFLTRLGFEKEPAHRTSEALLYGFLVCIMLGTIFVSVMFSLACHHITYLSGIIGGLFLCYSIYDIYKREEKYKWRRREEIRIGMEKLNKRETT